MTFNITLDSSILISHLTGDVHQGVVLAAMERLDVLLAELTLPLLCYAELWTGVQLFGDTEQQRRSGDTLHNLLTLFSCMWIMIFKSLLNYARMPRCLRWG